MSATVRFRDAFRNFVPPWLSDRYPKLKSVGYQLLWTMIAPLDAAAEHLAEGIAAAWPSFGSVSGSLDVIGRTRGLLRGKSDTDADYAARLLKWLEYWREAGSAENLARQLHEYLAGRPRVRVITRSGVWVTVNADGTVTRNTAAWNWDGTSNPERAGYWSEMWIVIYPTPYAQADNWGVGTWGDTPYALGHNAPVEDVDAVKGIIAQWKSAHTRVRSVLWCTSSTRYDPTSPGTLPNGQWGEWSVPGTGAPSARNLTETRYWEEL